MAQTTRVETRKLFPKDTRHAWGPRTRESTRQTKSSIQSTSYPSSFICSLCYLIYFKSDTAPMALQRNKPVTKLTITSFYYMVELVFRSIRQMTHVHWLLRGQYFTILTGSRSIRFFLGPLSVGGKISKSICQFK